MSLTPTFYTVYQFSQAIDDFEVKGVYTVEADANAHSARIETPQFHAPVVLRTYEAIVEDLLRPRLGKLCDVLLRMEKEADKLKRVKGVIAKL